MRVLICAASKHGATAEIAEAIADVLTRQGVTVVVLPPEQVRDLDGFDAVILGSGVYAGHWMPAAKDLAERHRHALRRRRVWLFSSGPIGAPRPLPEGDPVDVEPLLELTGAVEHRLFGGRIDRSRLRFGERTIVRAIGAPEGDYRDWDAIRAFGADVAAALGAAVPA